MSTDWATEYILDPLTAPEPNQETGPGTSHYNKVRESASSSSQRYPNDSTNTSDTRTVKQQDQPMSKASSLSKATSASKKSVPDYPTPPGSVSPKRNPSHTNNPYNPVSLLDTPIEETGDRTSSPNSRLSPPTIGRPSQSHRALPHRRSASAQVAGFPAPDQEGGVQRSSSTRDPNQTGLGRSGSLRQRYPGDMSHRPLDIIKKQTRTAERRHKPKQLSETDIIDSLDTIGGAYHHGGPYDATLASRNIHKKFSPVAAVEETNMKALRATPQEYIDDSLTKHMPLHGTAQIPNGGLDMRGNIMTYEEGADLMREPDAPGGAYKRWEGIPYHKDDLKGKGEPSYTYEKDNKKKERDGLLGSNDFEMRSGVNNHRHRRASHEGEAVSSGAAYRDVDSDVRRSNTTGRRLSDGMKRRFGSLRKRNNESAGEVR